MRRSLILSLSLLAFGGCAANTVGVTPSQNTHLQTVSPSTTAASQGGAMQRSLDSWLKEEWNPMTSSTPSVTTTKAADGTVITTKTEATQIVTTKTGPNGTVVTTTKPIAQAPEDNTPFTLQKYADKWKEYNAKKAKMKESQPQEPSNIEKMANLPVIGK